MKAKAILLCLGLIAIAFGAQDTIRFSRHLKEGDQDTYKLHVSGNMQAGDLDFTMKMVQLVKKVYDNGDADLDTTTPDFHITMNGNEVPAPPIPEKTIKVDKNGVPKEAPEGAQSRMEFMRYMAGFYDKDLKVGDTVTIDHTDPKDSKNKMTGTVKLDSVTDGVAKLLINVTTTSSDSDTPSKIVATMYINVATSKMSKIDGTVDSMPIQPGIVLSDVKITMERLQS